MKHRLTILLALILSCLTPLFAQQKGKASYYSRRSTGSRTASGSRIHHDSLECAHRTHPFGTLLLVKNPANGKQVVVKVVDRGPHTRGRIIDLTYAAARELGIISQGVATVEVSVYEEELNVPFLPHGHSMPELELEVNEDGDSIVPVWQRK